MATTTTGLQIEQLAPAEPSQAAVVWKRFRKHKLAMFGLVMLSILVLGCVFAPLISPYDPDGIDLLNMFGSGTAAHWLGTDDLGRDIFTRLLYAGRSSLLIGITVTVITVVFGTLIGLIAGYFGGIIDTLLMRLVDLFLTLPSLPILLVSSQMLSQYLDTKIVIITVLSVLGWLGVSRLVRGTALSLRSLDFMEATKALGANKTRILLKHMLPNSLAPIIVTATLGVGDVILTESALSFLGYGIKPPTATWGNMLTDVNNYLLEHPLLAFYPGLCILLTVISINFMGDALRDALDPRLKQ